MKTFKREIQTILFKLRGSPWITHPQVADVIIEYVHLESAGKTPSQERRVSLQIFHSSRAIDSLLAHVVRYEAGKRGVIRPAVPTLRSSLRWIQRQNVGGQKFTPTTFIDISDLINARNAYMHEANTFPADEEVRRFLNRTIRAINEVTTFPL